MMYILDDKLMHESVMCNRLKYRQCAVELISKTTICMLAVLHCLHDSATISNFIVRFLWRFMKLFFLTLILLVSELIIHKQQICSCLKYIVMVM